MQRIPYDWSFVSKIHHLPVDFNYKGIVMRIFNADDVS